MAVASGLKHAQPRRWTVEEYHRLFEAGIFPYNERLELIDGALVPMMEPDSAHWHSIWRATTILVTALGDAFYVGCQSPIKTGIYSAPRPDYSVCERARIDAGQPAPVLLVIEVSDTSLDYDREDKSSIYAAADIPEYWIVNTRERTLEVRRDPVRKKGRGLRHGYRTLQVLDETTQVSPLCRPEAKIAVADLL